MVEDFVDLYLAGEVSKSFCKEKDNSRNIIQLG